MATTKEPNYLTPTGLPESESDMAKFEVWVKENIQVRQNGCWDWKGAFDKNTNVARYKNGSAATYVFKITKRVPDSNPGRVFRTCNNNLCVNPEHARLAIGPRTKAKVRLEETLGSGGVLTKGQFEEVKEMLEKTIVEAAVAEVQKGVAKEVRAVEKAVVEGVVAELIRVRFDEMVARAIREGR